MRQKLWLVSEVFYPDIEIATGNIATEIAMKFAEDFEVHIICGPKDYENSATKFIDKNIEETLHFHRVNKFNFDKNKSFARIARILLISISMYFIGFKIKKRDKVFVISNPAFITPFFSFLKFFKGFEFTMLIHDVFPENLIPGGYIKPTSLLYKLTHNLFRISRRAATKMIVLGRDMKQLICEGLPKDRWEDVVIVPNWADIEHVFPIPIEENEIALQQRLDNKIVVQFAGNHGVLQNLMAFLKIIEKVENPDVHFVFAGGGATRKTMVDYVQEKNISNVSFLPSFPRTKLNLFQNACTIGLVSLSDELYGVGVPSKSYNILASGKPILFLGNTQTEIALFVQENKVGWAFSYQQEPEIVAFLNNLKIEQIKQIAQLGQLGRQIVKKEYNKDCILDIFKDIMK